MVDCSLDVVYCMIKPFAVLTPLLHKLGVGEYNIKHSNMKGVYMDEYQEREKYQNKTNG